MSPKRVITTSLDDATMAILDRCKDFGVYNKNDLMEKGVKLYAEYYNRTKGVPADLLSAMETIAERISLATSREIGSQAAADEVSRIIKLAVHDEKFVAAHPQAAEFFLALHTFVYGAESSNEQVEGFDHVFEKQ